MKSAMITRSHLRRLLPAQAAFAAANAAYENARLDCAQLMTARDDAAVAWSTAVMMLAAFTESATNGDAAAIQSAGFAVKTASQLSKTPNLPVPRSPSLPSPPALPFGLPAAGYVAPLHSKSPNLLFSKSPSPQVFPNMPYNPNIPLDGSLLIAGEMRSQFAGIVDLMNGILPSVTAVVDDTTTLPAGDMAQASASFEGTTMHFTFAIPQGQDGQQGPQGPEGPQGATVSDGPQGPPFANAVVDGVTTLPPGDNATVEVSFDGTNVHFTFGIPQGQPGEVTTGQMDAAIADAVATTAQNPSGIGPYTGTFSDPPTQAEMEAFAAYVESLRAALVR